jgi:GNAT superfamily N-acetyltransferase
VSPGDSGTRLFTVNPPSWIRDAFAGDAAGLAALVADLGYATAPRAITAALGELGPAERVIVAEAGGEVLGFVSAAVVPFFHDGSRRLRLTAIAVAPAHRRRGVARTLVAEIERWGREQGCNRIEVTSAEHRSDAHAAYRALGFAEAPPGFTRRL